MTSPCTAKVAFAFFCSDTLFMVNTVVPPFFTVSVVPLRVAVSPVKLAPSMMKLSPHATLLMVWLVLLPVVKPDRYSMTPVLTTLTPAFSKLACTLALTTDRLPSSRWPPALDPDMVSVSV